MAEQLARFDGMRHKDQMNYALLIGQDGVMLAQTLGKAIEGDEIGTVESDLRQIAENLIALADNLLEIIWTWDGDRSMPAAGTLNPTVADNENQLLHDS